MAFDITSLNSSQQDIEMLIDTYMAIEERPKVELEEKKEANNDKKAALTELDSKLSALQSKAERLSDPITNYFKAKKATSSDEDKFAVTASYDSELGSHNLAVERLAVSDTRVSEQYTDSNTSFTSYVADQTFTIEVGHPTDDDDNNRESISVTVEASVFSQNDDQVLYSIASAINDAMSSSVTGETIESDEIVRATVITEVEGTSRIMLRSNLSGYKYRMDYTDSTDGLLSDLQINKNSEVSGTNGGYMTDVGSSSTTSELNSKFTLDGLTFYRDSNSVDDALTGVTIQFLNTFSTNETLTVTADTDTVRGEVNDFLDSYNEVITYLDTYAQMDPNTYQAGILASDTNYRGLKNEIRSMVISSVDGVTNSSYSFLNSIGIESDDEGLLSIAADEDFVDALEANPMYVYDIFRDPDNGIANVLDDFIEKFVKVGGTITDSKNLVDDRNDIIDDRISILDTYLEKKRRQYEEEFTRLTEAMALLNAEQSYLTQYLK